MDARPRRLGPGVLLGLLVLALAAPAGAESRLTCETLPSLIRTFLTHHIQTRQLGSEVRRRAIDSYLERIDPSRSLLLTADVESIRESLEPVFDEIHAGDCGRLEQLQKLLVKRLQENEAMVRDTVSRDDYAVDPDVSLIVDPDRRGWAETQEQRRDLNLRLVHFQMSNYQSADLELAEAREKLIHRYELMTRHATEQTGEDIYARFLDTFATALDPHTNYFSRDAHEDFQIGVSLSLEGIGVALSSQDGYSVVEKVIPGGATDRLGDALLPQDKIIAVGQEDGELVNVIDMSLRNVVRRIRGKRGTKVTLTVLRQAERAERFNLTIVRDKIDLEDQAARVRFVERPVGEQTLKLAILELPSFYGDRDRSKRQCADDVARLLREVKREKADGLLLDISGNGGGILDHAVRISGFFVRGGGIVAVQDAKAKTQVLRDPDPDIRYDGPLVVLTSRLSASGSEILAGALRDYRRAVIVGDDHTFGKGTVQSIISLPPGLGALKVTTAVFFRPGGRSTQNSGVTAHIRVPSPFAIGEVGEISQPYALEGRSIDPFLRDDDLVNGQEPAWKLVTPELVASLAERSTRRVESSEDFQKIREQLEKADSNEGVIHLEEMLKDRETSKQNGESGNEADSAESDEAPAGPGEAEEGEEPLSPQAEEALDVLTDFVTLTRELRLAGDLP